MKFTQQQISDFSNGFTDGNYGHAYENNHDFESWLESHESELSKAGFIGVCFGWHSSLEDSEVDCELSLQILQDSENQSLCNYAGITNRV